MTTTAVNYRKLAAEVKEAQGVLSKVMPLNTLKTLVTLADGVESLHNDVLAAESLANRNHDDLFVVSEKKDRYRALLEPLAKLGRECKALGIGQDAEIQLLFSAGLAIEVADALS